MVTISTDSNIETIESIVQYEGDVDICEYDSNTFQQKPLFELHGICNVILKERQKNLYNL